MWQQLISALIGLFYILERSNEKLGSNSSQHCLDFSTFWCQAMKNVEAPDLSIVYTFLIFRHKIASISNPVPNTKTRIQDGSLARRGDKFEGDPSQHCIFFWIFCCEAMKNLEAADLSTVYAFPIIGDNFEGSRSHVVIRILYFFVKKTCQKNT